jgi:hypothetical protein
MDELLFHRGEPSTALREQARKVRAAVEGEADDSLMQSLLLRANGAAFERRPADEYSTVVSGTEMPSVA